MTKSSKFYIKKGYTFTKKEKCEPEEPKIKNKIC